MDSPSFRQLCFLLLTAAALRPNIAMPSDNPAERTQDSSSGKTNVTVYDCKDCESNACESSNYEDCAIIFDTQNDTFSNEKIHLVTSERDVTMCFCQENTFSTGIYAMLWERDVGLGESCGIVDFEAFSETVSGNNIKICCTVVIDPSVSKRPLKCYTAMSGEKTTMPTADVTAEVIPGNLQNVIGEKSSTGIVTTVLILGVCAAALAIYCVRQKRNGQGPVTVLHHFINHEI